MFNEIKDKLVIIGAGYGGIQLVKELTKTNLFDITLINDKPFHIHQTDIHKYLNDEINDKSIFFDIKKFCDKKNINFICERVEDIDFKSKSINLNNKKIDYDYLTIATGSISFFPRQIENISKYSKDIKDISTLEEYKKDFLELTKNSKKNKNIAIIGAGLSGVEIALEFAKKLNELKIKKEDLKISLIEQFPTILPNSDERLITKTTQCCDELGIQRYHGNFVNKLDDNTIYLSNNTTIEYDMVIINIGVTCEKLFNDETVKTNQKNQIIVDEYLRIPNYKEVFVIGDIAETKSKDGNYNLPTAQVAKLQAKLTGKNLKRMIEDKNLIKNKVENRGVLIDLTGKNAIGLIMNYQLNGIQAFLLKRFVSFLHKKSFA